MFKDFILKLSFVKDAISYEKMLSYTKGAKQGAIDAFPAAQKDILETMADDIDVRANKLADEKLAALLSVVDPKAIVSIDKQKGIIYIGGLHPDSGRLQNLKSEAEFILNSDIWHLLSETPKELAQRSMFVSGETLADMQKGKSMLFTLSAQKNILETFKSYKPKPGLVDKSTSSV